MCGQLSKRGWHFGSGWRFRPSLAHSDTTHLDPRMPGRSVKERDGEQRASSLQAPELWSRKPFWKIWSDKAESIFQWITGKKSNSDEWVRGSQELCEQEPVGSMEVSGLLCRWGMGSSIVPAPCGRIDTIRPENWQQDGQPKRQRPGGGQVTAERWKGWSRRRGTANLQAVTWSPGRQIPTWNLCRSDTILDPEVLKEE